MTLEVAGAMIIGLLVWNIYNLVKICLLENKVDYLKGQVETLIRRKESTQTNTKNETLDVR